jgi:hypothetical protein
VSVRDVSVISSVSCVLLSKLRILSNRSYSGLFTGHLHTEINPTSFQTKYYSYFLSSFFFLLSFFFLPFGHPHFPPPPSLFSIHCLLYLVILSVVQPALLYVIFCVLLFISAYVLMCVFKSLRSFDFIFPLFHGYCCKLSTQEWKGLAHTWLFIACISINVVKSCRHHVGFWVCFIKCLINFGRNVLPTQPLIVRRERFSVVCDIRSVSLSVNCFGTSCSPHEVSCFRFNRLGIIARPDSKLFREQRKLQDFNTYDSSEEPWAHRRLLTARNNRKPRTN